MSHQQRPGRHRTGPLFGVLLVVVGTVAALTPVVPPARATDPTPEPTVAADPTADPTPDPTPDPADARADATEARPDARPDCPDPPPPRSDDGPRPRTRPDRSRPTPAPSGDPGPGPTTDPTAAPTRPPSRRSTRRRPATRCRPSIRRASPEGRARPSCQAPAPSASPAPLGPRVVHSWVGSGKTRAGRSWSCRRPRRRARRRPAVHRLRRPVPGRRTTRTGRCSSIVPALQVVRRADRHLGGSGGRPGLRASPSTPPPTTASCSTCGGTSSTALHLRLGASDDPLGTAVEGVSSAGREPACPSFRSLPHTFTEVEFAVRATTDADWRTSYQFQLVDGDRRAPCGRHHVDHPRCEAVTRPVAGSAVRALRSRDATACLPARA